MVKKITTEKGYVFWALGIVFASIAKAFWPAYPFIEFAGVWTFGFLGVGGKRLMEKHVKFRPGEQ